MHLTLGTLLSITAYLILPMALTPQEAELFTAKKKLWRLGAWVLPKHPVER